MLLALNYAAMTALAIAINLIPVFLTTLSAAFGGLGSEQLGRIGAMSFAGLVAGIAASGPLADRIGAKPFVLAGNTLIALGLLVFGTAHTYFALLLAAFLMGLGAGVLDMVLSPIVCALRPENRAAAMNWLHAFYCFGAVITVLSGAAALRFGMNWRTVPLLFIVMPALVSVGFLLAGHVPLQAGGGKPAPVRSLLQQPHFVIALAAIFLGGATELGLAQWLPAYTELALGYSQWTGAVALIAFSLAMGLGRLAAGALSHRFRPLTLLIASCQACAVLFVIGSYAPWPPVALGACIAAGLAGSCLWPSMLATSADRFPRGGATMFALLAALGNAGGVFMPWAIGVAADRWTLRAGLAMSALCPLLMALLLSRMSHAQK